MTTTGASWPQWPDNRQGVNMAIYRDVKIGKQFSAINIDTLATSSSAEIRATIAEILSKASDSGEGLDGRALEIVQDVLESDGELFSDGECLDIIGRVIDIWRATEL
jgi:hypothetical protein